MAEPKRKHPLLELTKARMLEFVREPEALFWVFAFPVLLALALGVAFRERPEQRPHIAVLEGDDGVGLVDPLSSSHAVDVSVMPEPEARRALRTGKVDAIVRLQKPGGVAKEGVTFIYDASRPEGRAGKTTAEDALQRALGRPDVAAVEEETVTQPGARYIDFLIPGLIGLNLMGSGMWGLGFTVVQARNRKLLKRLAATPMKRWHYLLSFMLSRLFFLVLEVGALVAFGWLVFGVRVTGSWLGLALVSVLGGITFAGLGLLVAARPRSVEVVSGWMNFVMLPMWLMSGSFFSYERFPAAMHPFIRALPLTALNDALRAIMNDGLPLWAVWQPVAVMAAWAVVSFVAALKLFRWQ